MPYANTPGIHWLELVVSVAYPLLDLLLLGTVARLMFSPGVRPPAYSLLCVGILCLLMFQIFENVGMTMGIMPVTGIPLPFVSYGGSSTITYFAAMGLVLNVHMRRFA